MAITERQVMEAISQILTDGILRIRGTPDLSFCMLEADHLHNLPGLLVNPLPQLIQHYFNFNRPSYLYRLTDEKRALAEQRYGEHWAIIEQYLKENDLLKV